MSDDIVARLREAAQFEDEYPVTEELHTEAADEIERLRAELAAERGNNANAITYAAKAAEERDALRAERDAERIDLQRWQDANTKLMAERDALRAELATERKRAEKAELELTEYQLAHDAVAVDLGRELTFAEDQLDSLRKALMPFAVNEYSEDWMDGSSVTLEVTMGDVRRARAALEDKS